MRWVPGTARLGPPWGRRREFLQVSLMLRSHGSGRRASAETGPSGVPGCVCVCGCVCVLNACVCACEVRVCPRCACVVWVCVAWECGCVWRYTRVCTRPRRPQLQQLTRPGAVYRPGREAGAVGRARGRRPGQAAPASRPPVRRRASPLGGTPSHSGRAERVRTQAAEAARPTDAHLFRKLPHRHR